MIAFRLAGAASLALLWGMAGVALAGANAPSAEVAKHPGPHESIDQSGRKQIGRASYYAPHFANRRMADGGRFNPNSNMAASRTLPFGTTAKVTNLNNGRSALVQVRDRGPREHSRIMDVTPKVADQLGMKKSGAVPVVIAPIVVAEPNGAVQLGTGAVEVGPRAIVVATKAAQAATRRREAP
jgi:rare lipoprotein A